jgi:hypothetical protein
MRRCLAVRNWPDTAALLAGSSGRPQRLSGGLPALEQKAARANAARLIGNDRVQARVAAIMAVGAERDPKYGTDAAARAHGARLLSNAMVGARIAEIMAVGPSGRR